LRKEEACDVSLVISRRMRRETADIAILIPCYNEAKTIAEVVAAFKSELPSAVIYVFDNGSTDNTAIEAKSAGAVVHSELRRGKGNVVGSMFRRIDADIYVMVDGDGTYPPEKVHNLLWPIQKGLADMVVGSRLHPEAKSSFRKLNLLGNRLFLSAVNSIYKSRITDLLSGYRAFSRRVVKGLPLMSSGFDIETELTMKCLQQRLTIHEVPVNLSCRPEGSFSKIRVMRDGAVILIFLGLLPGSAVIREYLQTGYISRLPSAILSTGLVLTGVLTSFVGLVLHTIARRFQEVDMQLQNISGRIGEGKLTRKRSYKSRTQISEEKAKTAYQGEKS
jgi:glycosyltransferase involved in cell wall biosynthesis